MAMDPHVSLSWLRGCVIMGFCMCRGARAWLLLRSFFFLLNRGGWGLGAGSRGHLYVCIHARYSVICMGLLYARDVGTLHRHERGSGPSPRSAPRIRLGDADGASQDSRCSSPILPVLSDLDRMRYLPRTDAVATGDAAWRGMEGAGGGVMSHGRVTTSWLAGCVPLIGPGWRRGGWGGSGMEETPVSGVRRRAVVKSGRHASFYGRGAEAQDPGVVEAGWVFSGGAVFRFA